MFVANATGIHNLVIGQGDVCGTDCPPHIRIKDSRRTPAPARCDDLPHISVGTPSGVPGSLCGPADEAQGGGDERQSNEAGATPAIVRGMTEIADPRRVQTETPDLEITLPA